MQSERRGGGVASNCSTTVPPALVVHEPPVKLFVGLHVGNKSHAIHLLWLHLEFSSIACSLIDLIHAFRELLIVGCALPTSAVVLPQLCNAQPRLHSPYQVRLRSPSQARLRSPSQAQLHPPSQAQLRPALGNKPWRVRHIQGWICTQDRPGFNACIWETFNNCVGLVVGKVPTKKHITQ